VNDFEVAMLARHPEIASAKRRLQRAGARRVMMTGSGAAVFGLYATKLERDAAANLLGARDIVRTAFISRAQYRAAWRKFPG
jgi:4-diphosphocytidyl-2-C-methyl-D-erythritol kinase